MKTVTSSLESTVESLSKLASATLQATALTSRSYRRKQRPFSDSMENEYHIPKSCY
jgi:hypothetical protein